MNTTSLRLNDLDHLTINDIQILLARRKAVAMIWHVNDFAENYPELTAEQCFAILARVERMHRRDLFSFDRLCDFFDEYVSEIDE